VAILRAVSDIKLSKEAADVHVCHTAYQRNALGTNQHSNERSSQKKLCRTILTTITCYNEIHSVRGIKVKKQLTSNACTGGSKLFSILTERFMEAKKN
jgi:hypothetical protein